MLLLITGIRGGQRVHLLVPSSVDAILLHLWVGCSNNRPSLVAQHWLVYSSFSNVCFYFVPVLIVLSCFQLDLMR